MEISVQALGSSRAYRLLQNSLLAGPAWRCSRRSQVRLEVSVQALGSSRAYRLLQNSLLAGPAWRCSRRSQVRLEVSVQALGSFCVYRLCCTPFQRSQPGAVRGDLTDLTGDRKPKFRPSTPSVHTDPVVRHSSGASLALFTRTVRAPADRWHDGRC